MNENKTDVTETTAAAGAAEAPSAGDTVDMTDSAALLAAVTAERDQLARERAELYDQLLRRTAEFENFRRRVQRERSEFAEFAGMEVARELLPVLDDFERALKIETTDKEYAKGMELIYNRLADVLKKLGVERLSTEGQKFDPQLHHAVETVTTGEVEDSTVLGEHRAGYNFKGRLLRPAMVKVAVNPNQR
jgi:molecular chaperone GrpE